MRFAPVLSVAVFAMACGSSGNHQGGAGGAGAVDSGGTISNVGGKSAAGASPAGTSGTETRGTGGAAGQTGTTSGAEGGEPATPGDVCAYTDTTSKLNAIKDSDFCDTGYCLWDGRYFADSYCTIPCTGNSACPKGYECVADARVSGKSWCAITAPTPPADMGSTCPSEYLPDCTSPYGNHMNFCMIPSASECESYCVYDGASKSAYCSTPCRNKTAPCPDGWDCWHNPGVNTSLYDACMKHHPPAELTGLSCQLGGSTSCQEGVACVGTESGIVPSCAPTGGICLMDVRPGAPVKTREYCTMRCETDACPAGFECLALTLSAGVNPNGKYCLRQLPSP